jgi:hypothetical protein
MAVLLRTNIVGETLVVPPCALARPGVERQRPWSLDHLPGSVPIVPIISPPCVPVVPAVSLQIDLVFFDLLRSL